MQSIAAGSRTKQRVRRSRSSVYTRHTQYQGNCAKPWEEPGRAPVHAVLRTLNKEHIAIVMHSVGAEFRTSSWIGIPSIGRSVQDGEPLDVNGYVPSRSLANQRSRRPSGLARAL